MVRVHSTEENKKWKDSMEACYFRVSGVMVMGWKEKASSIFQALPKLNLMYSQRMPEKSLEAMSIRLSRCSFVYSFGFPISGAIVEATWACYMGHGKEKNVVSRFSEWWRWKCTREKRMQRIELAVISFVDTCKETKNCPRAL